MLSKKNSVACELIAANVSVTGKGEGMEKTNSMQYIRTRCRTGDSEALAHVPPMPDPSLGARLQYQKDQTVSY